MSTVTVVTQLVLRERQARDRRWWDRLRTCFHADAPVFLSWLDGSATEFVDGSRAMSDAGLRPVHRLAPPVVEVADDRAVVEMGASIAVTVPIEGTDGDLVSFTRLLYQVQRRDDDWRIASLTAIYEDDRLTASLPGTTLAVDADVLARFRRPYRFLGYHHLLAGRATRDDLYGDDQPDRVDALYEHVFGWLYRRDRPAGRP